MKAPWMVQLLVLGMVLILGPGCSSRQSSETEFVDDEGKVVSSETDKLPPAEETAYVAPDPTPDAIAEPAPVRRVKKRRHPRPAAVDVAAVTDAIASTPEPILEPTPEPTPMPTPESTPAPTAMPRPTPVAPPAEVAEPFYQNRMILGGGAAALLLIVAYFLLRKKKYEDI